MSPATAAKVRPEEAEPVVIAPSQAVSPQYVQPAADNRRSTARQVLRDAIVHVSPASWAFLDLGLVALATFLAYKLLIFGNPAYRWVVSPWISGPAFCGCITLSGIVFGLYEQQTLQTRSRILVRSLLTLGLGVTLAFACVSVFFYADVCRSVGLLVVVIYLSIGVPLRLLAHGTVTTSRVHILCVGAARSAQKVLDALSGAHRDQYHTVGYLSLGAADGGAAGEPGATISHLGGIDEIAAVIDRHNVDQVVVDGELGSDPCVGAAVMISLERGCRVTDRPTFVEKLLGQVPAEDITAEWFLLADVQAGGSFEAVKRIGDLFASALGMLLTLPLWPLIALLVRLDSPGPVIFRQRRVGLHGRCFSIYKFRTMRVDAEANGAQWAQPNDERATRVGRFLRKSRLDELPQLWNILHGDMSLVGPRPERPEFVEQLVEQVPHYRQRHLIKPGLTGWAQIHYRYGASVADAHRKLCYDLFYLKHRSIDLDVAIIIRTIGTFLLGSR